MAHMALSELQLVIFGDSWTDGGYHGQGVGATGVSNDPMEEVFCGPIRKIGEHFGSKFHFKECGYYEGCPSDGLTWPYHVGVKKVLNFACSGATSCQYVEKYVEVPPGYVAMPQSECLVGHRYHARGVAQQIRWAAKILPQEIWNDKSTWVIIGPLSNDVIYYKENGIGSTISEVSRCPFVQNHRQFLEDLKNLGVNSDRILSAGVPCLDLLPGLSDMDPVWVVNAWVDAMLKQPHWRIGEMIRHDLWNDQVLNVKLGMTDEEKWEKIYIGNFIATAAEVTPKGSLVRESYPKWP